MNAIPISVNLGILTISSGENSFDGINFYLTHHPKIHAGHRDNVLAERLSDWSYLLSLRLMMRLTCWNGAAEKEEDPVV